LLKRSTEAKRDSLLSDYAKGKSLTINKCEGGGFVLHDATGTDYLANDADEAFRVIAWYLSSQRLQAEQERTAASPVSIVEILPKRKRASAIFVVAGSTFLTFVFTELYLVARHVQAGNWLSVVASVGVGLLVTGILRRRRIA
jgi:hypothetical protein